MQESRRSVVFQQGICAAALGGSLIWILLQHSSFLKKCISGPLILIYKHRKVLLLSEKDPIPFTLLAFECVPVTPPSVMVSFITGRKKTPLVQIGENIIHSYFLLMDSIPQCAKYSWERVLLITSQFVDFISEYNFFCCWNIFLKILFITVRFVDFISEYNFSVVEISICEYLIDCNENFIPQQNWIPLKCAQKMDFRREDIKTWFGTNKQTNK